MHRNVHYDYFEAKVLVFTYAYNVSLTALSRLVGLVYIIRLTQVRNTPLQLRLMHPILQAEYISPRDFTGYVLNHGALFTATLVYITSSMVYLRNTQALIRPTLTYVCAIVNLVQGRVGSYLGMLNERCTPYSSYEPCTSHVRRGKALVSAN